MAGHRRNAAGVVIAGMAMIGGMSILLFDGRPDGANLAAVDPPIGEAGVVIPSTPLQPEQIERRRGVEPGTSTISNPVPNSERRPISIISSDRDSSPTSVPKDEAVALPSGCLREFHGHADWIPAIRVQSNGAVFSASVDGTIRQWSMTAETENLVVAELDAAIVSLAVAGDSKRFACVLATGNVVIGKFANSATHTALSHGRGGATCSIGVGTSLVVGDGHGWISIWDWETARLLAEAKVSSAKITAVSSSGTSHENLGKIVAADLAGRVHVVALATSPEQPTIQCERTISGPMSPIFSVAVSPDGMWAVTGARDGIVRVWDLVEGVGQREWQGHSGWVNSVSLSPDGKCVATAGADRTIRVWRFSDGKNLATFEGAKGPIAAVAWALNTHEVLSAGGAGDPVLRLWQLSNENSGN